MEISHSTTCILFCCEGLNTFLAGRVAIGRCIACYSDRFLSAMCVNVSFIDFAFSWYTWCKQEWQLFACLLYHDDWRKFMSVVVQDAGYEWLLRQWCWRDPFRISGLPAIEFVWVLERYDSPNRFIVSSIPWMSTNPLNHDAMVSSPRMEPADAFFS